MHNVAPTRRIPAGRLGATGRFNGAGSLHGIQRAADYINGYTIAVDGGWLAR